MDVVCPVRATGESEEFRYSLRSLVNLDHDRVLAIGHAPAWYTGERVVRWQTKSKPENTMGNLLAALRDESLSESIIWMNDDMFAMRPDPGLNYHGGPFEDYLDDYRTRYPGGSYTTGLSRTLSMLRSWGIANPMAYSIHYPLVVNRADCLDTLGRIKAYTKDWSAYDVGRLSWRTLYGNMYHLGGTEVLDCKVHDNTLPMWIPDTPWLSTSDKSFARFKVGRYIRAQLTEPSPYEVTQAA